MDARREGEDGTLSMGQDCFLIQRNGFHLISNVCQVVIFQHCGKRCTKPSVQIPAAPLTRCVVRQCHHSRNNFRETPDGLKVKPGRVQFYKELKVQRVLPHAALHLTKANDWSKHKFRFIDRISRKVCHDGEKESISHIFGGNVF